MTRKFPSFVKGIKVTILLVSHIVTCRFPPKKYNNCNKQKSMHSFKQKKRKRILGMKYRGD